MSNDQLRPIPTIIRTDKGKLRTSTGRWSTTAMANHVNDFPATMHDFRALARVAYGDALPHHAATARHNIRNLANTLEERGVLTVTEFVGRKIHAVQVFNRNNEYHQQLMANEIGRRKIRADGSAEKLEHLLKSLPPAEEIPTSGHDGGETDVA